MDAGNARFYVWPHGSGVEAGWLVVPPEASGVVDCTDMDDAAFETFVSRFGLMYDMRRRAKSAIFENVRHSDVTLGLLLSQEFPEATDEEIDQIVKETL